MTNEEIIKELSGKTVLEINELVKALEEAWGVSAAAAVAVAGPAAGALHRKNPRNAGNRQLKADGADTVRIDRQHGDYRKSQGGGAVVFSVHQLGRQHQSGHDTGPGHRGRKAGNPRKQKQQRNPHNGSQEPLPERNGTEDCEQDRDVKPGHSNHMANAADLQRRICLIRQLRGVTQQQCFGKGHAI